MNAPKITGMVGNGARNAPADLSDANIERVIRATCSSTMDCRVRWYFGDPNKDYVDIGDMLRDLYTECKRLRKENDEWQALEKHWRLAWNQSPRSAK